MRRLAALVLVLSVVGCGSQVRQQAVPSPTPSPTATPTPTPSTQGTPDVSASATSSATASPTATTVAVSGSPSPVPSAVAGQRYAVTAQVVHLPGKADQVCAPASAQPTTGDPKACVFGIDAVGIDFANLQDRVEKDGAVRGRATLTVTLDAKRIPHVVDQSLPPKLVADPGFRTPPCTAPTGGWPKGKDDEQLDQAPVRDYRSKHPNVIVAVAQLRPSKNQVVEYVLTNGDPAQVDKDLRPSFGGRFCAFKSTWTRTQADNADTDAAFRYGRARGVYLRDSSVLSESGQLEVRVGAVIRTDPITAAVKKAPAGLVRLEVLLTPVIG